MGEIDMHWIAGIFEGEGSIGFGKDMSHAEDIQPFFSIGNDDLSMLLECQKIMGGKMHTHNGKSSPNAKALRIQNQEGIRQIAMELLPYVRSDYKKHQIENFLARDEQMRERSYRKGGD